MDQPRITSSSEQKSYGSYDSAFDRRHPANFDVRKEVAADMLAKQRRELTIGYMLTEKSMEEFFSEGNPRPDFGDESY